ncbi:MAG TPA: GNAT family protein [Rhodocyclaceae bacterium]|nr:GNAT family protein [Rhodocyclaceae bacterium]
MFHPPADLTLRGVAVTLRPLRMEDAPALAEAAAESRDTYGFTAVPEGEEGARAYIARADAMRDAGQRFAFAIEFNGRIVGSTSYAGYQPWSWPMGSAMQRTDGPDVVEIGYTWLSASAQRSRCNSEAKRLLLSHAFEQWQVHRVYLKTDARNVRSRAAIERLGAKLDGVIRADMPAVDGTVRDSAWYSILAAEWPGVKAGLEARLA